MPDSKATARAHARTLKHARENPSLWLVGAFTCVVSALVLLYLVGRKLGWWGPLVPGEGPVVAALFVVCAAALTYYSSERSRRLSQAELAHEETKSARDHRRQRYDSLRERFLRATEQLASEKSSTVRIAGVYSFAALANDWYTFGQEPGGDLAQGATERQVCVDILCAYLRSDSQQSFSSTSQASENERAVRNTVVSVISSNHGLWCHSDRYPVALNLVGANLSNLELSGKKLGRAKLLNANFEGAILLDTNFEDANLTAARMEGADLVSARLDRAILKRAKLQGAKLNKASLLDANLAEANLQGAVLKDAQLTRAVLRTAKLERAMLRGAILTGADLSKARMQGADLTGAHLEGAQLVNSMMQRATCRNAHLEGANLSKTRLEGTNFRGALLEGTDFKDAHFGAVIADGREHRTLLSDASMNMDALNSDQNRLGALREWKSVAGFALNIGDSRGFTQEQAIEAQHNHRTAWPTTIDASDLPHAEKSYVSEPN